MRRPCRGLRRGAPSLLRRPRRFTAKADIERLEKLLRSYIYAKVPKDGDTKRQVQKSFSDFDTDGSGAVSMSEFIKALERFGMHTTGQRPGVGGLPLETVQGLFDKYDKDSSGQIDYKEFTTALFAADDAQSKAGAPPPGRSKVAKGEGCADTAYLKLSNHIFGPISRGEAHADYIGGMSGIGGGRAQQ